MTFADAKEHTEPLFKKLKLLKFKDHLVLLNCFNVHDFLKGELPCSFVNTFSRVNDIHNRETSNSIDCKFVPRVYTVNYGRKSITRNY